MGDVSAEPSMEDILASIKRIISEEDGGPPRTRGDADRDAPPLAEDIGDEAAEPGDPSPDPVADGTPNPPAPVAPPIRTILSSETAQATREALDSLSRLVIKTEPPSEATLESLVREMLRPMLREWIDAKLPGMVETMVSREIARITTERG